MSSDRGRTGPPSRKRKRNTAESSSQDDELFERATSLVELLEESKILSVADNDLALLLRHALRSVLFGSLYDSILDILKLRFTITGDDERTQAEIKLANGSLDQLSELYQSRLEDAKALPPPSSYAKHSTWAECQQRSTAILCLRPSDKQGLPLCVLDNVFREFQRQVGAPLPSTEDARKAMNVAFDLCNMMPDHFTAGSDRGELFDKCLHPIFPHSWWRKEVYMSAPTELRPGKAGRAFELDGVVGIFREDKVETGTGDDAYMQVSRVYQLYVEKVRNEKPSLLGQGAPVFLLCPCGGFYDTKSAIIEPLVEPCLMFDDSLHTHQEALARKLFALKQAVITLSSRSRVDGNVINPHPAGVPRVYTTYTAEDNTERSLTFLRPLKENSPRPLLFIATEDPTDSSTHKLVKLVVGKYGAGAH
ncbi:hypothetical protein FRC01_008522 [Tulasnella sp. 417]|nr:hypothetical protein FRC01_008522 [Tulasnella sp. 417]